MTKRTQQEMFAKLAQFNTPSISNIVATYPNHPLCLKLYDPWNGSWYTDTSIRSIMPELGRAIGYAVTFTYSLPGPDTLPFTDLIAALYTAPKPVIAVFQHHYPPGILTRAAAFGGQTASLFQVCGVTGVITDSPIRDLDEIRPTGIPHLASGVTPGHGPLHVRTINTPVVVAGMEVKPGELIHLDEHGAVKFPANQLEAVCDKIEAFDQEEKAQVQALQHAENLEEVQDAWNKYT